MTDRERALLKALERASNAMDQASHRLQNVHKLLANDLDREVSAARFTLRECEPK